MLPELRRYIQHISLSPDSINNDDVCSNSRLAFFILILAVFCGIYVMCDILPGCFPSHEVLTRHYGHPDRKPCKRKSNQVLFNSLFTINIKFLFLHFFLKKKKQHTDFCCLQQNLLFESLCNDITRCQKRQGGGRL